MIIVLVVLVVIFVITLGIGGCHGGGDTDDAGAVRALKGLQGNRFLEIGDKASVDPPDCEIQSRRLQVTGSCRITFAKRAFFRRSTRVVLSATAAMGVIIDPNDGPTQNEQLAASECFASAVSRSGGTMTLSSPSATVFLLQQGCPE